MLHASDIHLGPLIGKGQFGSVYSGTLQRGNEHTLVAVKTIDAATAFQQPQHQLQNSDALSSLVLECITLHRLNHPHIVELVGLVLERYEFF